MNPVTTQSTSQDREEPDFVYITPLTITQLRDACNKIEQFQPTADPHNFFERVRQQAVMYGLDKPEEVKLIVMSLDPSVSSALPDPQNVGGGSLQEIKAAILDMIGYNRGDPVEGLNRWRQKKGEHPIAYAVCFLIHFNAVFGDLVRAHFDNDNVITFVSHATEAGQKPCVIYDPADATHNEVWVLKRLSRAWEQSLHKKADQEKAETNMNPVRTHQDPAWVNEGRNEGQHPRAQAPRGCYNCGQKRRFARECNAPRTSNRTNNRTPHLGTMLGPYTVLAPDQIMQRPIAQINGVRTPQLVSATHSGTNQADQ
ncbi:uncharacterized protein [Scyliorhinus torazame]|uniref:uncharacterized protein n=1 Tax=Scyliorhinus torazame TaxID=75743 RepID=UPI003B5B0798